MNFEETVTDISNHDPLLFAWVTGTRCTCKRRHTFDMGVLRLMIGQWATGAKLGRLMLFDIRNKMICEWIYLVLCCTCQGRNYADMGVLQQTKEY